MKISYDPEIDALYIRFVEGKRECRTVRLTQAQNAELAATKSKLNELSSAFGEHKTETGNQLATIGKETTTLRNVLAEVQASLTSQGKALTALEDSSKDTAARLNETLEKLKKSFFVRGAFK